MSFFRRIMLSGGMPIDIPESRKIYYTASAKITPDLDYDILTNTWNSSTGEGVIVCKTDITSIGNGTFSSSPYLKSISIPNSVTAIGHGAFYGCNNLTSVIIGNSVTEIGENVFGYCYSLKSIYIPNSVASIGNGAFKGCGLSSVTIGNGVTSIGDEVFSDCGGLTNVTIPDSVIKIGEQVFKHCSSLTSVTIGNGVTSIGGAAFYNCNHLSEFNGKFASEDKRCLVVDGTLNSFAPAGLTEYTIPDGVTSIGNLVFYTYDLTSISIPEGVTSIGDKAFYSCTSLTSITIPDSVTSIGENAFGYCRSLTDVMIPNHVVSIGYHAFYECDGLTSITIPNSVTTIGDLAFYSCNNLISVTIGNSVTSIGHGVFFDCRNLSEVYCKPTTPPTGDSSMFGSNASVRMIYVPRESVDAYKAAEYWSTYAADIVAYDFDVDEGGNKLTFPIYLNKGDNGQLITDLYNYLLPKIENEGEYTFTSDEIIYVHDVLVASASRLDETRIRLHLSTYKGHDIIEVFIWNDGVLSITLD